MTQKICLFGAGGHAKVVQDAILSASSDIETLLFDDRAVERGCGSRKELIEYLRTHASAKVVVAIGHNEIRKNIYQTFQDLGLEFVNAIHAKAVISDSVSFGLGVVVMAGAVVNPDAQIGHNVIINTGAVVEHDNMIHNHVHIGPNATLCGGVEVGAESFICAGATVLPGIKIGERCTVGAGAVVLNDLQDDQVVVGVPARRK